LNPEKKKETNFSETVHHAANKKADDQVTQYGSNWSAIGNGLA
jgi:hypothetical protein